jgi:hypothetical protein
MMAQQLLLRRSRRIIQSKVDYRTLVTTRKPISKKKVAWQAEENEDIQRVTQKAIVRCLFCFVCCRFFFLFFLKDLKI